MGRPVVHFEFWSQNPEQLSEFYKKVFDWKEDFIPELNYRLIDPGGEGGIKGGIMTPQKGPWPGNLALYIDVDDIDSYLERIKDAGGKIVADKMEVPEVGLLALFEDTDGRVLGVWQRFGGEMRDSD